MSNTPPLTGLERTIAKEELDIHYDQLKTLDENLYRYSSVFFTINAALLAFLAQLLPKDATTMLDAIIYLAICFLGYTSSACFFLITYKGYYTWEIKQARVRELEHRLGYKIEESYYQNPIRQRHPSARILSISKIRIIFNGLLAFAWVGLILLFQRLTHAVISDSDQIGIGLFLLGLMIAIAVAIIGFSYYFDQPQKGNPVNEQRTTHLG